MSFKLIAATSLAVLLTFSAGSSWAETLPTIVVDPAIASMTPEQLVSARQAAMKEDGGILRNAGKLTGAEAVTAATTLLQNFTNFPALFREGSITPESGAKPIIWEQFDDFTGLFAEDQAAAQAMLTAAVAGDAGAYADAVRAIGQSCGNCHQTYRAR